MCYIHVIFFGHTVQSIFYRQTEERERERISFTTLTVYRPTSSIIAHLTVHHIHVHVVGLVYMYIARLPVNTCKWPWVNAVLP